MHTGKSRNDQVATDLRLILKEEILDIQADILKFILTILDMASQHTETIMVGYTHLQHAQPTTFAHHLLSYAYALKRDYQRLQDAYRRVDMCPLGSAALTTTSFPINRDRTRELLGFSLLMENSIDGVSSRDFMAETVSALSILSMTLSRICEELIIWSTYEFGMIEIAGEYSSTSSIMPQKKNPDVAEIARAKTAAVYGELTTILTILKSLPQSYNRDLQEVTPTCGVRWITLIPYSQSPQTCSPPPPSTENGAENWLIPTSPPPPNWRTSWSKKKTCPSGWPIK